MAPSPVSLDLERQKSRETGQDPTESIKLSRSSSEGSEPTWASACLKWASSRHASSQNVQRAGLFQFWGSQYGTPGGCQDEGASCPLKVHYKGTKTADPPV